MVLAAVLLSLLALAGTLSIVYCVRGGAARARRGILCALRLLTVGLLALSFIQPTLRLTRLAPERATLGILVDVSASMRMFEADSAWRRLAKSVRNATEEVDIDVRVGAFGDSARALSLDATPEFDDSRSFFPSPRELREPSGAQETILLSDGNWSNVSPPSPPHEAAYHYLRLEQKRHRSFVAVEPAGPVPPVPQDSGSEAAVRLSGYSPDEGAVELLVRHRGKQVFRRSIPVPAGHFSDSVRLPLPTNEVGTRLYEVTAALPDTSPRSSCYLLQRVQRGTIDVALSAAAPSLDKRFITLAIDRHPRLRRTGSLADADAVVFFDWDRNAGAALREIPPHGAVAFIGSAPCPSATIRGAASLRPVITHPDAPTLPRSLPAPAAVVSCDSAPPRILRTFAAGAVAKASGEPQTPLLFEASYEGRRVLVAAARGIWRWDFWPLGVEETPATSRFTDFLMERIVELAETNANRSFYAYPTESPVYETDSLKLALAFPASLADLNATEVSVTIVSENADTVVRTVEQVAPRGANAAQVSIPPLRAGSYRYECRVLRGSRPLSYADRLTVGMSDAELRVTGQNRVLLEQVASPLDAADSASVRAVVERLAAGPRAETVTRTIKLRQSAAMLALLVVLLAVEWFLRRAWRLD